MLKIIIIACLPLLIYTNIIDLSPNSTYAALSNASISNSIIYYNNTVTGILSLENITNSVIIISNVTNSIINMTAFTQVNVTVDGSISVKLYTLNTKNVNIWVDGSENIFVYDKNSVLLNVSTVGEGQKGAVYVLQNTVQPYLEASGGSIALNYALFNATSAIISSLNTSYNTTLVCVESTSVEYSSGNNIGFAASFKQGSSGQIKAFNVGINASIYMDSSSSATTSTLGGYNIYTTATGALTNGSNSTSGVGLIDQNSNKNIFFIKQISSIIMLDSLIGGTVHLNGSTGSIFNISGAQSTKIYAINCQASQLYLYNVHDVTIYLDNSNNMLVSVNAASNSFISMNSAIKTTVMVNAAQNLTLQSSVGSEYINVYGTKSDSLTLYFNGTAEFSAFVELSSNTFMLFYESNDLAISLSEDQSTIIASIYGNGTIVYANGCNNVTVGRYQSNQISVACNNSDICWLGSVVMGSEGAFIVRLGYALTLFCLLNLL